jgi:hypothetical protein
MRLTRKLVLLLVSILLVIGEAGCMSTEDKVLTYLEDKYNQKFEIEGVKKGSKFFSQMYGGDKVTVHLKNNPEIVFLVEEDSEENGVYYDNYILAKWAEELKRTLTPDIEKQLPPGSPFKILVYIAPDNYKESMVNMSFAKYLTENKNEVDVVLMAGIKTSGSPDINQYSEGVYNLYNLLMNQGFEQYTVSIGFVDDSEDITDFIRTAYVNNIEWSNLKARVYGEVNIDEEVNPIKPNPDFNPKVILTGPDRIIENYKRYEKSD